METGADGLPTGRVVVFSQTRSCSRAEPLQAAAWTNFAWIDQGHAGDGGRSPPGGATAASRRCKPWSRVPHLHREQHAEVEKALAIPPNRLRRRAGCGSRGGLEMTSLPGAARDAGASTIASLARCGCVEHEPRLKLAGAAAATVQPAVRRAGDSAACADDERDALQLAIQGRAGSKPSSPQSILPSGQARELESGRGGIASTGAGCASCSISSTPRTAARAHSSSRRSTRGQGRHHQSRPRRDDPQGTRVHLSVPSAGEAAHDFLWRAHLHAPARGEVVSSIARITRTCWWCACTSLVPRSVCRSATTDLRLRAQLIDGWTHIIKFFLHISVGRAARRSRRISSARLPDHVAARRTRRAAAPSLLASVARHVDAHPGGTTAGPTDGRRNQRRAQ